MNHAPSIITDRLTLRGHAPGDLDALAAMWADPAVYAMIGGAPRPREDVWIRLLRSIGQWTLFGYGAWVVEETATGRVIGDIGLIEARRAIVPPIDGDPEMGWTLVPAAQGKGFAGEALAAILDWADARGMARTVCIIDPGNDPSIRLAGKMGYVAAGEAIYHDKPIGVYRREA